MNEQLPPPRDDANTFTVETSQRKTADRPHRITIILGSLSPALALISLAVSFYVFKDSRESTRIAQRAYASFHLESATIALGPADDASPKQSFQVGARLTVQNIGNTPAYILSIKQDLHAIDGDDMSHHIGGRSEVSPDFDTLAPKGASLSISHDATFTEADFNGDRSVVYEVAIDWRDAFGEKRPPIAFCAILAAIEANGSYSDLGSVVSAPGEERKLNATPCVKGFKISVGSR